MEGSIIGRYRMKPRGKLSEHVPRSGGLFRAAQSLVDGIHSLVDGAHSLVDGVHSLVDGAHSLVDGVQRAVGATNQAPLGRKMVETTAIRALLSARICVDL